MLKISHKFFLVIIFSLTTLFAFAETSWVGGTAEDNTTVAYTKGDECYVLIRRDGKGYQEGVAIKTTEKPTVQWNFYTTVNGSRHNFSLWGENYDEDFGPDISEKCITQLQYLPNNVQKELREYGVLF